MKRPERFQQQALVVVNKVTPGRRKSRLLTLPEAISTHASRIVFHNKELEEGQTPTVA